MYSSLHFFVNLGAIHVVHVHHVLWHFITGSQYVYNKETVSVNYTACIPLLAMQIHYVYIVGRNNVEISKLQS